MNISSIRRSFQTLSLIAAVIAVAAFAVSAQSGSMKGRVRSNSGAGISGATVTAKLKGADIKTTTTDSKGNFTLSGMPSGIYNVEFEAAGFSTGIRYNLELKNGKSVDLGDRLILNADIGNLVVIKGSVFFKEGTSLGGAKVELEEVMSDGTTKKISSVLTNVSGEYTFKRPDTQTKYRLTAKYKNASGSKDLAVDSAAIYRLAITLDISRTEK